MSIQIDNPALVDREWTEDEIARFTNAIKTAACGPIVPSGPMVTIIHKRAGARCIAATLISAWALATLVGIAALTDLSAWIDRVGFAFAWVISARAALTVYYDGRAVWCIVQAKTGWGI